MYDKLCITKSKAWSKAYSKSSLHESNKPKYDVEEMVLLRSQGLDNVAIAARLGCAVSTVWYALEKKDEEL